VELVAPPTHADDQSEFPCETQNQAIQDFLTEFPPHILDDLPEFIFRVWRSLPMLKKLALDRHLPTFKIITNQRRDLIRDAVCAIAQVLMTFARLEHWDVPEVTFEMVGWLPDAVSLCPDAFPSILIAWPRLIPGANASPTPPASVRSQRTPRMSIQ
jgi:hypothetical protein